MTRPQSYQEIFQARGNSYDLAMAQYPNARDNEFITLIERLSPKADQLILDMPSGGGYLARYQSSNKQLVALDACSTFFTNHANTATNKVISKLTKLPFANNSFDGLASLAGLHHEFDKLAIFQEMHRVLKPEAKCCIADVAEHSNVAMFLDTIVDKYNSLGHQGSYLNSETLQQLTQAGFKITSSDIVDISWQFKHMHELVDFTQKLFGLDKLSIVQHSRFLSETIGLLGIKETQAGVQLNWQLNYINGVKQR